MSEPVNVVSERTKRSAVEGVEGMSERTKRVTEWTIKIAMVTD